MKTAICSQEDVFYKSKEDQARLLQMVIAASDQDAEEERIAGEIIPGGKAAVGVVCLVVDL